MNAVAFAIFYFLFIMSIGWPGFFKTLLHWVTKIAKWGLYLFIVFMFTCCIVFR